MGKDVRVVEEIGIRKEASDRTETVRDTVRKTEVDVEDTSATVHPSGTVTSVTGSTGHDGHRGGGTHHDLHAGCHHQRHERPAEVVHLLQFPSSRGPARRAGAAWNRGLGRAPFLFPPVAPVLHAQGKGAGTTRARHLPIPCKQSQAASHCPGRARGR